MSERLYQLRRETLSEIARALHDGGRISVEELHAILSGSASAPERNLVDDEDTTYAAYLEAIGEQAETVTIEKENSDEIEIDSLTAEVLEAEDRARLARVEQEEREAQSAWPAFCATMQIEVSKAYSGNGGPCREGFPLAFQVPAIPLPMRLPETTPLDLVGVRTYD